MKSVICGTKIRWRYFLIAERLALNAHIKHCLSAQVPCLACPHRAWMLKFLPCPRAHKMWFLTIFYLHPPPYAHTCHISWNSLSCGAFVEHIMWRRLTFSLTHARNLPCTLTAIKPITFTMEGGPCKCKSEVKKFWLASIGYVWHADLGSSVRNPILQLSFCHQCLLDFERCPMSTRPGGIQVKVYGCRL